MPGLDRDNMTNGSDHLRSSSSSSCSVSSSSRQAIRNRVSATTTTERKNTNTVTSSLSPLTYGPASDVPCDSHVTTANGNADDSSGGVGIRKFTWKELSQLHGRHNAHVAYRGKVYDVSSFISKHPGGVDQIMMGAGRDITQVFESYHKHDTFTKVLDKYYVGELVDNELPVFPKEGEFYRTVKQRVERYMKEHNLDPKIDYWAFFRHGTLLTSVFVCWYFAITLHYYFLVCLLFTCIWGLLSAVVGLTCYHDASHFTITHKPWVWKVVMTISESINGTSSYCWWYQHVFGHHLYTNIDKADPDIYTPPDQPPSVWRIKAGQQWIDRYVYQHLYMPFVYTMLGVKMRLQDLHTVFVLKKSYVRMNPLSPSQWAVFCTGKIVHVVMRFIIPYFFMPFGKMVLMNIIYDVTYGFWLAQLTQVNHVTEEVDWPVPDKDNVIHSDWAELQVRTTQDYCTDSWIWYFLSGGLNHQTAHHLFPGVLQSHYHWVTPIVKQTCAEFGIKYNGADSFKDALSLHFSYLKKMGSGGHKLCPQEHHHNSSQDG